MMDCAFADIMTLKVDFKAAAHSHKKSFSRPASIREVGLKTRLAGEINKMPDEFAGEVIPTNCHGFTTRHVQYRLIKRGDKA